MGRGKDGQQATPERWGNAGARLAQLGLGLGRVWGRVQEEATNLKLGILRFLCYKPHR